MTDEEKLKYASFLWAAMKEIRKRAELAAVVDHVDEHYRHQYGYGLGQVIYDMWDFEEDDE